MKDEIQTRPKVKIPAYAVRAIGNEFVDCDFADRFPRCQAFSRAEWCVFGFCAGALVMTMILLLTLVTHN